MKGIIALLFITMLLGLASPAFAHRLDEYLQATTIVVEKDRVELRLHLTPGVDVAGKVLAGIDMDGDGLLSETEQRAYAGRVRDDLSLAIDGRVQPLRLVSASFPPIEGMRRGVGDMFLIFQAYMPVAATPTRRLTLGNHHESAIAIYLVNMLEPRDRRSASSGKIGTTINPPTS